MIHIIIYIWYMSISYNISIFYIHRICRTSTFLHPLSIWSLIFWAHFRTIPTLATASAERQRPVSCCAKCEGFSILSKSGSSGSSSGSTCRTAGSATYGDPMGRPWEGWWKSGKMMEKVRLISMSLETCGEMDENWDLGHEYQLEAIGNWDGHDFNSFLVLDISGTIPCIQWHKHHIARYDTISLGAFSHVAFDSLIKL